MTTEFRHSTKAKSFDENGRHTGPGPWLDLIHAANRIETIFEAPLSTRTTNEGIYIEEYPDARVIDIYFNDVVTIVSTTERGHRVLTAALAAMEAGR